MPLAASEIRETFLRFFERRGHRRVASASLVPDADPTLLFTNAGMVPFKRLFLGEEARDYVTATTAQKCIRVSGKHNDLENVGRTPRHHTFFEMLGNFSFGDYFKQEAIEYAWELVTGEFGIDAERLVATVYAKDDEAYDIWRDAVGLPEQRVLRLGESENFWSMGDTGPCGPCAEIHVDFGENQRCTSPVCDPSCDCGRWLEIWNLVFMQFDRDASGKLTPLPKPSIDTGAGLERLAAVIQNVHSNYDTDLFRGILARVQEISGVTRGIDPEKDVSLHVVADHARAISFLVGDGVLPSNEGRGYVLRRILRRAARHGVLLGVERPFLCEVANVVIDEMSGAYPELSERRAFIVDRIRREEERFLETLTKGLALLEDAIDRLRASGGTQLPGEVVFKLYDTFGFPVDLTEDILKGHGLAQDRAGFEAAMGSQRARARAAWRGSGDARVDEIYGRVAADVKTVFRGYETLEIESRIRALLVDGVLRDEAREGETVEIVVEETPFYAESGGQVGDRGLVTTEGGSVEIRDAQRPTGELVVHRGRVTRGAIRVDTAVRLAVDAEARAATVRNHSGTHLLHAALRAELGPQAMQKGSLVAPDRLRFDFTHDAPLSDVEICAIEDRVNAWIERDAPALIREMSYAEAIEAGAIAIFEEKYGDRVRVISFGDFSTELCGGTHARATGELGLLKIVSQSGIAAGVRRVEALTGLGALEHLREQERALARIAELLRAPVAELPARVEKLLEERKSAEQQLAALRRAQRGAATADLTANVHEVSGVRVVAAAIEDASAGELRGLVDELRNRIGSGVVLLAAASEGRVSLALGVTADLTAQLRAGDLVREVAAVVGGKGGGRPDFAQAGGDAPERLEDAFARLDALIEEARA
ncbi:MAG: alanine--tRNA ligase [Myxococcales bacterium]|nr:alanine--tRNA ligase [Myxococcales bacterium]